MFFILGIKILDPDFGCQLKNGQIFLASGIFYKDPYSYTMPSFPVVSHEWLSDIVISVIYKYSGFDGLAFVFSLLFLIPLYIFEYFSLKKYIDKKFIQTLFAWNLAILVLTIGIFFNYFYVRPQIFSWVLWMPFVWVLINRKRFEKFRFYLPFLFLIWANLHGGFAIGIVFVFLIAIFSAIQTKRLQFKNLIAAVLCFTATLINPFGLLLWREVFATFFNSSLRIYIGEWRSLISFGFTFLDFLLLSIISTSVVLVWQFRKKMDLTVIIIYLVLLVLGVSSVKNVPYWLILNLVLFPDLSYFLLQRISNNKISVERFRKAGRFALFFSVVLAISLYYFYATTVEVTFQHYPEAAIKYLSGKLPNGQIFSQYGWGGYLEWKLPQKKVFIDGRMGVWSWSGNKPGETNNAFDEYNAVLSEKVNFNEISQKYNIDIVLWPKENNIKKKSFLYELDKMTCKYIWLSSCLNLNQRPFGEILADGGWRIVYQDDVSVIYSNK